MHINLPDDVKAWIETAESFLKETKPWEVEAEMNNGKVPEEIDAKHRQMAIDLGLSSMDMPKSITLAPIPPKMKYFKAASIFLSFFLPKTIKAYKGKTINSKPRYRDKK